MDGVSEEMRGSLRLDGEAEGALPDPGKKDARGLDTPLRPALLLHLHTSHFPGKLAGNSELWQKDEAPAGKLRPIAEIQILGQRSRLPAAGTFDAGAPPHPGRPVEVEEEVGAKTRLVLDLEVRVEEERLGSGQPARSFIQISPRGLHHADALIRERHKEAAYELRLRDEIGIQHEEELARRPAKPVREGSSLVAHSGRPADVLEPDPSPAPTRGAYSRDRRRLIRRIVEELDVQQMPRIVQLTGGVDQTLDDVGLVVYGQLNRDPRQRAGPACSHLPLRPREPPEDREHSVDPERHEKQQDEQVRGRRDEGEHPAWITYATDYRHDWLGTLLTLAAAYLARRNRVHQQSR